jgi:tetratricopeptide (TPR) repeat protein
MVPQDQLLIDQIAIKLTDANPTVDYDTIKRTLETSALQTQSKGENVQKALNYLLQQVTKDGKGPVAQNIIDRAMKENNTRMTSAAIIQQVPINSPKDVPLTTGLSREELYEKGSQLSLAGKYEEAMPYIDRLLSMDPVDQYALYEKGSALYGLHNYEEAIIYLDKVLLLNQNDAAALLLKGHVLNDLGRYEEAITYYDKLTNMDPSDTYPLFEKGRIYYDLGKYKEAMEIFDQALSINPNDVNSLNWKGNILVELGKESEAKQYFDKALAVDTGV